MTELQAPKQPPKYMFWLAQILGKQLTPWSYHWRGRYWIMGDAPLGVPLDGSSNNRVSELMAKSTEAMKDLPWKEEP